MQEKQNYEEPVVTMVEFDSQEVISTSGGSSACNFDTSFYSDYPECFD